MVSLQKRITISKTMNLTLSKTVNIIFIFSLTHVFLFTWLQSDFGFTKIFNSSLLLISMLFLVVFTLKLINANKTKLKLLKTPYILLIIWSLFTITRSLSYNPDNWMTMFGNHYLGAGAWLTPLALIIGYNIFSWKYLMKLFIYILFISIIITPLYFVLSDNFVKASLFSLYFSLPLLVLLFFYLKLKYKIFVLLSLFSYIISAFYYSYRTVIIVISLTICFALFEYVKISRANIIIKSINILIITSLFVFSSVEFIKQININENDQVLLKDTRTFLLTELIKDMSPIERIVGRGALGKYYSKTFADLNKYGIGIGDNYRGGVEIGYLHLTLKGGYIMLILYLSILLPSVFLGIFRSENFFTKSLGYYILIALIVMFVNFPPVFDPFFLLVWFSAGSILNKNIRNSPNDFIIHYIGKQLLTTRLQNKLNFRSHLKIRTLKSN